MDKHSKVRGQWIPYDIDAINQFLGNSLILEEWQQCEYIARRSRTTGFDEEAIGQLLCFPGCDFVRSMVGRQLRIMMTLTQIWMTFLLSNIFSSGHTIDLTLPKSSQAPNGPRKIQQGTGISCLNYSATIAWPRDRPIFQEEAGPTGAQGSAQGDGGRVEDDEDMTDLVDYFIGGD
ncbi:hypothetical protein HKD37_20G055874 [Glycine soja]